ncbi:hypothetical protein AVEN_130740-1 [Araneus ventricosus]|uniref:Uncharacterized protein n=1 Tax=Araneus ventricosus TaxID=182803 RepID=A0A4Y2QCI4_ARAVE|nr:hypothetical protein AVEN_130740-1 [Araneus ventricosus]
MNKVMLWMACCYHVRGLVLEAVVTTVPGLLNQLDQLGFTTGPGILMFKCFKNSWNSFDHGYFQIAISDVSTHEKVINRVSDSIEFHKDQLEEFQPLGDYKESHHLISWWNSQKRNIL